MKTLIASALATILLAGAPAFAQGAPAAPAAPAATAPAPMSTAGTTIGTLMDNPEAKAVLVKYIKETVENPEFEQARSMTFKDIQPFVPTLSDETLAKIDADLAKIPAK